MIPKLEHTAQSRQVEIVEAGQGPFGTTCHSVAIRPAAPVSLASLQVVKQAKFDQATRELTRPGTG